MGAYAGPDISESGLVLALDAGNTKSYKYRPGPQDHGISDWYCFTSGTATYSAIYPNTQIIEIDGSGNETVVVTTGSDPQRGSITITSGRRYYGTKAIHILDEGVNDAIAPVSFAGTYFGNLHTRGDPKTMNIYAPYEDISVNVYENVVGGVTGTATSTFSVSKGSSDTFVTTQGTSVFTIFATNKPAIMTVGSGSDDHVMQPMSNYVYRRRNAYEMTINNTAPSNPGDSAYVAYDTSLPLFALEIGDGAGSDSTQGIGYENLSDTYSWGNTLSDYQIVAPYANTTVTVSYWDSGTSSWVVGETHSLSGTQTNPDAVDRDGTNGFGVDGTVISGAAADLASGANLWKFEGTQPFALIINDSAADEETLLGWMSNKTTRTTSNSDDQILDLSGNTNDGSFINFSDYNNVSLNGYITFDGVDDGIVVAHDSAFNLTSEVTVCVILNQTGDSAVSQYQRITDKGSRLTSWLDDTDNKIYLRLSSSPNNFVLDYTFTQNQTYYIAWSYDKNATDGRAKLYANGDLVATSDSQSGDIETNTSDLYIGNWSSITRPWKGPISYIKIYNRALTASEIQQNFNATRSRFGI